ncbi:MAG TPA: hypothetical protein VKR59_08195 [Terriglobales bacterium]|nr:hypothetical protein [Terriglobales bacterium]
MTKRYLLAAALLSLTLAGGCAKGGNGAGNGIIVTVTDNDVSAAGLGVVINFTATVTGTTNTAVAWSLSGTACTGNPNPCGTIDPNSGVYNAPLTVPSPAKVTITAVSRADSTARGNLGLTIVPVTVAVTPASVSVGQNLVQQFTAVAVPDNVPQTFTWSCTPTGACGNLVQDPNISGLATYTAPAANGNVVVSASSTLPGTPAGVGQAKATVITNRVPAGAYAFQFSGYEGGKPVAVAGTVTISATESVTAGFEDVLINGVLKQLSVSSGSFVQTSTNNNLGMLTLNLGDGSKNIYTAVLTSSGTIRMVESAADGTGRTGSGTMQKSSTSVFNSAAQTFTFGFSGIDPSGNRVGYVGLLPMTPNGGGTGGTITGGLVDSNDNGSATSLCGTPPCAVSGTYTLSATPGVWQMVLNVGANTLDFDFYVSSGTAQTKTGPGPLTLYALSTHTIDPTHPAALSGSMVYQVPMTYNNAAFAGTSVSNLTGANGNVALVLGTTDGTSGGTGGTGGFSGQFDQNNNGNILSVGTFPTTSQSPSPYTYVATNSNIGRYAFQMLGNPNASPVVAPIPFVLYASGANRGFLLDQSSTAVMTGSMDPQAAVAVAGYANTEMPGTYAVATISNSDSGVAPIAQNLLLTSPGGGVFNVTGTQNPGNTAVTGTYNIASVGVGTITLTSPAAGTFVIYGIDAILIPGSQNVAITDFEMMETCAPQAPATTCTTGPATAIAFAQE